MKTVLITGSSRGIGAVCAEVFANNGYNVAINYNKSKTLAESLALKIGGKAYFADVKNSQQVNSMVENVIKDFGKIDVLINNAGIAQQKLFTDITENEWDNMIDTNLKSAFLVTQAVLQNMIKNQSGSIVNVSSMWGQVGGSCEVHYSASKAGIIGLTKALAKEMGLSNIRVNCVCPGVINTEMNSFLDKNTIEQLIEETPLNKLGEAIDVANAVLYFAESDSSFVTGQVLGVNGGMVI